MPQIPIIDGLGTIRYIQMTETASGIYTPAHKLTSYYNTITTANSSGTTWYSITTLSNSTAIKVNTDQDAYIGYDSTSAIFPVPNTLDWHDFPLPESITTLYWKHATTSGTIYVMEIK